MEQLLETKIENLFPGAVFREKGKRKLCSVNKLIFYGSGDDVPEHQKGTVRVHYDTDKTLVAKEGYILLVRYSI